MILKEIPMEDLSKKIIFISGISGFTGIHLENFFLQKGCTVYGTTYQKSEHQNHFTCDITDKNKIKEVIKKVSPDYVIHAAAISFVAGNNQEEMYKINVFGTLNLLNALVESKINPEKILIASSAAVYGNIGQILSEDMCPSPINHYGNSKLVMENMVKTYFSKLNIIITRPFNYTGIGQTDIFLIPKIVSHFKKKKQIIELGNINVYREFNDVDFLVNCYYELLKSKKKSEVFNVCSGEVHTVKEIILSLEEISKYKIETKINPKFVRKHEITSLKGSPEKLFGAIRNLSYNYDLKNLLEKMYFSR